MKFFNLLLILFSSPFVLLSQNYADKEYYLIDSLNYEELSASDKQLIDSCLKVYHNTIEDTLKIYSINEIVNGSWDVTVWPKYNEWVYNYSSSILKKTNNQEHKIVLGFIAGSLNNSGLYYSEQGNIKLATKKYFEALDILNEIGDDEVKSSCLNNIGILYFSQDDLTNALKYFEESLSIKEKLGNHQSTSAALNNIGFIYGKQKNYAKAKEYYLKSLKIRNEIGDKRGIAESLNNLGTLSKRDAEKIEKNNGNKDSINTLIKEGLNYFKESIAIQEEIKDIKGMSNTFNNIAHIYYDLNDMPQALKYGLKALDFAKIDNNSLNIKNCSELLYRVNYNMNKFEDALEMYQLFISTRDTINNIETQKTTIEQNLQYEFDKKEVLTKLEHEKELTLNEAEKKKQQIIIWAVTIVLILIVGFSVVIAHRLKISNKQKLLIEQKNKENELLLGEIHHRVKNNLQIISSLLSLQERTINDEKAKAAIIEGKERVKSMGLIHKMLYQKDNYAGVEMENYGSELIKGLIDSFGMKEKDMDVNLNFSKLKLDIDTAIPIGLIINELVINSLKYAYEKTSNPSLKVSLTKQAENLILEVSDNGNGKAEDLQNSTSFGMKLIKSLSRQIGGSVSIENISGINVMIRISDFKLV